MRTSVNGTNGKTPASTPAPRVRKPRTPKTPPPKWYDSLTLPQKLALFVGGVGTFVLLLSLWECTLALHKLTGMHVGLTLLLAIGVDCGMVACEASAILTGAGPTDWKHPANWTIWLTVTLSVGLNGLAAYSHQTEDSLQVASALVGGVVPVIVYLLGRVAGRLWTGH